MILLDAKIHGSLNRRKEKPMKSLDILNNQAGKIGYILLWLLGVPIPILIGIYVLRGCN
jgi:hypothetical protein